MFTLSITPRFYETDAFGHINNTVITGWFETAREPIFRLFNPSMVIKNLPLILARVEVDFVAQIYYGADIEIKTWIERIGNSSFIVAHEAWQNNQCVARGKAVQVYFDFITQKSSPIPEPDRIQLQQHVILV
ncbi:acyl-CoA thioesterase [Acinetobacter haemolyticus]|uniref:acyl-CoA thioesterase n=1 Tax=Acinetobacter haemolyticus TaxID=29430 RepID=UPI000C2BCC91|nr:thioesterase family protein [Acinetobacter haemolyticus]ATZ67578.1 thioesterase [Acinetobacter haemolyticus]